jgi:plasmid maintenance system antidote protein VapI
MGHIAKRHSDRCPTPPGALLRQDLIPATGRTKAEIADFSVSPVNIFTIFCASVNRCLLPSVRPGKLFGDGAGVWVRIQAAYDTWNAERKEEDVSKIPTLRAKAA